MSERWTMTLPKGGRLDIYPEALSNLLIKYGRSAVDQLAADGAEVARAAAPPNARRFIRTKSSVGFALHSRSIPSSLSRRLRIPVALIVNDSNYAVEYEVGSLAKPNATPYRPLGRALNAMGSRAGVRMVRGKDLVRSQEQYATRSRASQRKRGKRRPT